MKISQYIKINLEQQKMIKIDNSYLKKLDKMCFKKPILSIIDCLQNRIIMSSPMSTIRLFARNSLPI